VQHVERKSDGFGPFEEIMQQQADKRTPPKPKGRKRMASMPLQEELDEDGKMSMELDDSKSLQVSLRDTLNELIKIS
jgi:centromere protein C